jgi:periplasmic protein TonB
MLGYAQSRPIVAARRPSPNTMLAVIMVHVAVIAVVMSAKMELPTPFKEPPLVVSLMPEPPAPPPNPADPQIPHQPVKATFTQPQPVVPMPPTGAETIDPLPLPAGELVGPATEPQPLADPTPVVRTSAQLLTSAAELKPPYPPSKLLTEEEADLRLRLTIDANGRVVSVDPVGRADPVFLSAARRHLIARWRFKPASEAGRAVVATTVITLRFRLD